MAVGKQVCMNQKNITKIFFLILSIYATYFSNIICGNFLLILLLVYLLNNIFNQFNIYKKILLFFIVLFILFLSKFNVLFLIGFPILFLYTKQINKDNKYQLFFINSLLIFAILENIYYTGINLNFLYYFWGLPVLVLSFIGTIKFPKFTNIFLSVLLITVICGQIHFNLRNYYKNIYTYSTSTSICAKHSLLKGYFNKVYNLAKEQTIEENNNFCILPLCEFRFLNSKNFISPNQNYILLGEHDNMNNFIENYPYFNNDSFFRKSPWYLYSPNINASFKYFLNGDIFYSSNIGSTVIKGTPLIWEYNNWGIPILLVTFAKINNSNVFIFGDSDAFCNNLLPYNINFVAGLLGRIFSLYPLFLMVFIITNFCLIRNKKTEALILLFCLILIYFLPLKKEYFSQMTIYTQIPYLTAHRKNYPSSILNFLSKNDIAVTTSKQKDADIQVINKKQTWSNIKNSKLIYVMPNTIVKLKEDTIYCTNIKIGNEQLKNSNIIDSRALKINGEILKTGCFEKDNIVFVGTGSPQRNYDLTKRMVFNEK